MKSMLAATAALVLVGGSASAASLTAVVQDDVSYFDTSGLVVTDLSGSLSVPKFNPAFGNLLQVDWTVTSLIDGTIDIENTSGSVQSGSASTSTEFTLTSLDPSQWDLDIFNDGFGFPPTLDGDSEYTVSDGGSGSLNPGETLTINVDATETFTGVVGDGSNFAGTLSDWIAASATDTAGFDYETLTSLILTFGGGNVNPEQSTQASIRFDVKYTYETERQIIPVPAALPLMASALGVFGVLRYRKRK